VLGPSGAVDRISAQSITSGFLDLQEPNYMAQTRSDSSLFLNSFRREALIFPQYCSRVLWGTRSQYCLRVQLSLFSPDDNKSPTVPRTQAFLPAWNKALEAIYHITTLARTFSREVQSTDQSLLDDQWVNFKSGPLKLKLLCDRPSDRS